VETKLEEHLQRKRPATDALPIALCHASLVEAVTKLSGELLQEGRLEIPAAKLSAQIPDGWYSPRQLAEHADVKKVDIDRIVDRLRRPLREFRNADRAGKNWKQLEDRSSRQSPYIYRGSTVQSIIAGLLRRT